MYATLTTLLHRLDGEMVSQGNVIEWGSPIPAFGDISISRVASLGLNPSNREFLDEGGRELRGASRRFHTLESLGINSWSEIDARHLRLIMDACQSYFRRNPYDTWFRRLDWVVSGAKSSYYGESPRACHLDLIPYATKCKWTELTPRQRSTLLEAGADTLGLLLRDSPVRLLILNGRSVVKRFEDVARVRLQERRMPSWSLPRRSTPDVEGFAYFGIVDSIAGITLGRRVLVLGFNHNLQSSFGVTTRTIARIRTWVSRAVRGTLR